MPLNTEIPPDIVDKVKADLQAQEEEGKKVIETMRKNAPHTRLDEIDFKLDKMKKDIVQHRVDAEFRQQKLEEKQEKLCFDVEHLQKLVEINTSSRRELEAGFQSVRDQTQKTLTALSNEFLSFKSN